MFRNSSPASSWPAWSSPPQHQLHRMEARLEKHKFLSARASNNSRQQPSPYHHIIIPRHPRLHKHSNSSSHLLSNSQTAGLVTLNTMTLMPLLLAGAAFAKVSFWTSNFFRLPLAIIQQGSRSIYPLFSLPRVT